VAQVIKVESSSSLIDIECLIFERVRPGLDFVICYYICVLILVDVKRGHHVMIWSTVVLVIRSWCSIHFGRGVLYTLSED